MAGINHEVVKAHGDKGLHTEWNADHKQTGDHDCEQHQHLNHVIENRTDWPAGPVVGQVVYRSDYTNFYGWNGTMWQSLTPVATIVVAADGTGNYTDIQDGIDALPAGGGVVYIKEGTYIIAAALTIGVNNTSLIGAGKSTIIRTNAAVKSLTANTKSGLSIDSIQFLKTAGQNAIEFTTVTDSLISRCWITGAENAIKFLTNSNYNTVINNHVYTNVGEAIWIDSGDFNLFVNNICWNNDGPAFYIEGDNNVVNANVCYDGNDEGIGITGDQNVITSNQVKDNASVGINITNLADRIICLGNVALGNGVAQILDNGTNGETAHNIVA